MDRLKELRAAESLPPLEGRVGPGSGESGAGPGVAPLEGASLILGKATPDTRVLTGLERPGETFLDHRAASADCLCLLDLQNRGSGIPDGEEQLRVLVTANRAVPPIHWLISPHLATGTGKRSSRACESFHERARASSS